MRPMRLQALFSVQGVGVHTGKTVRVRVLPAKPGVGIVFQRDDVVAKNGLRTAGVVPAHFRHVISTAYCTTLNGPDGASVATVEHMLSAFWGLRVRDALVEISGPEVPILDGSAQPWVSLLLPHIAPDTEAHWPVCRLRQSVRVAHGDAWIEAHPADHFEITAHVRLGDTMQEASFKMDDDFQAQIAPARTFTQKRHVEAMQAQGLIQGGSLACAVVLDDDGHPINEGGWRLENECARHKILDFLGDWSLAGCDLQARVTAYCSGHTLNLKLVHAIMDSTGRG